MRRHLAKLPALRLLLPLCAGILTQWYLPFSSTLILTSAAAGVFLLLAYRFFRLKYKFSLRMPAGMVLQLLIFTGGLALVCRNDNHSDQATDSHLTIARLEEPLTEKQNSYKAIASLQDPSIDPAAPARKLIVYFKKEAGVHDSLQYGRFIAFKKKSAPILNSGNPGCFDFRRYNRFQGIHAQVYLTSSEYILLPVEQSSWIQRSIYRSRDHVLALIRKYIPGEEEQGLAEALLIGYKEDLDKDLLRSYASTGVVHVIAISGLHLGIIYTILIFLTRGLAKKNLRWSRFLLILVGLWSFSLIAGAQASILRSAVMFSFLAAGTVINRKAPPVNTLALSAFLLLCWKPFWLWDTGFQLSYSAVLSLLLFYRRVFDWFYFSNRLANAVWQMTAVTLAAQVLTLPLLLYYFHQFPLLFLYTNLVAVPASSLILMAELLLVSVGWFPAAADLLGLGISEMIGWLNAFIRHAAGWELQFSGISITLTQTIVLYLLIAFTSAGLLSKNRLLIFPSLATALVFIACRSSSFLQAANRQQLIVYNCAKQSAADIILGHSTIYVGDSMTAAEPSFTYNIFPSRVQNRQEKPHVSYKGNLSLSINGSQIVFLDRPLSAPLAASVRVVVLSKNPDLAIDGLCKNARPQIVIDGSVPAWKQKRWKKECASLDISCHLVGEDGAFVMNL